jgi:cell division protein FtsW (lipid II flippase)
MLAAPFGFVLYLVLLLAFLWLAVRVVRHAWYWQSRSERSRH